MKKTVILILALLPIVLIITIAFAGKILSIYHHIPVDKVEFVDDVGEELPSEYTMIINVGETKPLNTRVYPEMASNPKISFISQDENICKVDKNGNVTGVSAGGTSVMVKTLDGSKTDLINVVVIAEHVTGVTLPEAEITMTTGEFYQLMPEVLPHTALNKGVRFTSDNEFVVTVSADGQIIARLPGIATVTVTTLEGGFTAFCKITVKDDIPAMSFDTGESSKLIATGTGYFAMVDEIDLSDYLICNEEKINPSDVRWRIISGNAATLDGGRICFNKKGLVRVVAYVGDPSAPQYYIQLNLLRQ